MKFTILSSTSRAYTADPTAHQLILRDPSCCEVIVTCKHGEWSAEDRWPYQESRCLREAEAFAAEVIVDVDKECMEYALGQLRGELEYIARTACDVRSNKGTYMAMRQRFQAVISRLDYHYGVTQ